MIYFSTALVAVLILFYAMPVTVSMDIERYGENDKITIGVRTLYGLLKFKSEIPFLELLLKNGRPALRYRVEVANNRRSWLIAQVTRIFSLDESGTLLELLKTERRRLLTALKYMAGKTVIRSLRLKIALGTGDAAETSIMYGITWIIIGNLMAFTGNFAAVKEPRIMVMPIFDQVRLSVDLSCIINIRLGHIINTGIRIIPALLSFNRSRNND